ncbi:MAG TPA: long-chain fatty acid--CoA ligase, partial [Flavobacteriales bacterium]|nr:long-chain fatty acid--CoA ligase [Flavobacteriales bacterium]
MRRSFVIWPDKKINMNNPTRLFDFPRYQLANSPLDVMLYMPNDGSGKSLSYSTKEFVAEVDVASRGLIAMGMEAGDKVALISHNNRCEWNVMDHAIMQAGGIDVPIYPTMTEADYKYILNHSESKFVFVSSAELFAKVNAVKDECPTLKEVFTFEDVSGADSWRKMLDAGSDENQAELDSRSEAVKPEQLATIIYTSGTTGLPKGVMLSHKNVVSNTLVAKDRVPLEGIDGEMKVLSFLPVCHIFERMLHYLYMYMGASIHFGESLETIKDDLNATQPIMFTAVPRLLEKFYDGIVTKGRAAGGVKTVIFNWALGVVLKWDPSKEGHGLYGFKLKIARKLVFSKVKEALGLTGIKAVASGSAALQSRLARFFNGAGIPVLEGYGLTETSPVVTVNTVNTPGMIKIGSVGKVVPGVEIGFGPDKEILVKGPNVMMGYYKDEEKTAEVIKDGWFHTGDIGELDSEGFLRITDRKKEIFKTSGGKYVAPALLENALKASLFIEQVIVVGEYQKHPSALISPNTDTIAEWCKRHNHTYPGDTEIGADKVISDRVMKEVDKLMEPFSQWERVKVIRILPEPFSIEGGELTPT